MKLSSRLPRVTVKDLTCLHGWHLNCWGIHFYVSYNTLQWRHNEHDGISIHQRLDCLHNRLFRHRSKETSKLCVTGHCEGNPPVTGGSPHKGPVTRKMSLFDDVIVMFITAFSYSLQIGYHMLWRAKMPSRNIKTSKACGLLDTNEEHVEYI